MATLTIHGWARKVRRSKRVTFVDVDQGTSQILQAVLDAKNTPKTLSTGCAMRLRGRMVESRGAQQEKELQVDECIVLGECDAEHYPLAKEAIPFVHLRTIPHLFPRTLPFMASQRIASTVRHAMSEYSRERKIVYVDAPLLTPSDCEGAGEMFRLAVDKDFFDGTVPHITVSRQLYLEAMAVGGLANVWTGGEVCRAEHSRTARHLASFPMYEWELCAITLDELINFTLRLMQYCAQQVLNDCPDDVDFFDKGSDAWTLAALHSGDGDTVPKPGALRARLKKFISEPIVKMSHKEAMQRIIASKRFPDAKPDDDLSREMEQFLCTNDQTVVVHSWPDALKSFYFLENDDETEGKKTVQGFDVLMPHVGEVVGGGMREHRLERLEQRLRDRDMPLKDYEWYLDLRRYGSMPHGGMGIGFGRLILFCTGLHDIRNVTPFPRAYGRPLTV